MFETPFPEKLCSWSASNLQSTSPSSPLPSSSEALAFLYESAADSLRCRLGRMEGGDKPPERSSKGHTGEPPQCTIRNGGGPGGKRKAPASQKQCQGKGFGEMGLGRLELPTSRLSGGHKTRQIPAKCRDFTGRTHDLPYFSGKHAGLCRDLPAQNHISSCQAPPHLHCVPTDPVGIQVWNRKVRWMSMDKTAYFVQVYPELDKGGADAWK